MKSKTPQHNIPNGARPFMVTVEPSIEYARKLGSWEVWKASILEEMEAEGITIVNVKGLHTFYGYYFPATATPRSWLSDDDLSET